MTTGMGTILSLMGMHGDDESVSFWLSGFASGWVFLALLRVGWEGLEPGRGVSPRGGWRIREARKQELELELYSHDVYGIVVFV